jgi:hypothetical protein
MCITGNYARLAWWNLTPGGICGAVRSGFATISISIPKCIIFDDIYYA